MVRAMSRTPPLAPCSLTFSIDAQILLSAIEKVSEQGAKGGVRDIARTIEDQIADGLLDAKSQGAAKVRLLAEGDEVIVVPVLDDDTNTAEREALKERTRD